MRNLPKLGRGILLVIGVTWLAGGCDKNRPNPGGKLPAPLFLSLETPSAPGTWSRVASLTPIPAVLPTKGRLVRVSVTAPIGSVFSVALRTPDGIETPLPENQGTPTAPETGQFAIGNVDVSNNPPVYPVTVRAPLALSDPSNYEVRIANRTLRTDETDSDPLVVPLGMRPIFTVTVRVQGSGHVTSTPPGIQCGTSPRGQALTACSFDFAPGPVSLAAQSNDSTTTKFLGWSGNCPPNVQVCTVALAGASAISATAMFGPRTGGGPISTCPPAPTLPGLRWIDLPDCATGNIAAHPGISHPALCDSNGYFCCEPGPQTSNAPRCGGMGKVESSPDCMRDAPRGLLRQPGGCYEIASGP